MSHNSNTDDESSGDDRTADTAASLIQDKGVKARAKRDYDVCGHCMKKVTSSGKSSQAFECDYCTFWVHASCEGMDESTYKKMAEGANLVSNINYYCKFGMCQKVSSDVIKIIGPTAQKVAENTKAIQALTDTCTTKFNELEAKIVNEVKDNTESIIEDKVKHLWELERERVRRSKCIIIANLPENPSDLSLIEKEQKDRERVAEIFKDTMGLRESDFAVQFTLRLGKTLRVDGHPRLLKIVLESESMVLPIMKAVKNLKSSTDKTIKNLTMFKDLIKEDREARNKLVKDCKSRNELLRQQNEWTLAFRQRTNG